MGAREDIEAQADAESREIIQKAIDDRKLKRFQATVLFEGYDNEELRANGLPPLDVRIRECIKTHPIASFRIDSVTVVELPLSEPTSILEKRHADREMGYELATLPGMDWWKKYDPERTESNWGRCCTTCDQAVPAGRREFHDHSSPSLVELRQQWARFCYDNKAGDMPTFNEWMHERERRKKS